ncbi:flagellar protein FliO/FliZ [Cytobacillus eiseniae]|uniref:Flagellar protein FliO/FliZ n=1 Tax=Cytobacillus eiseniae TaxID=762947 RepID=A0ABS4RBQ1_9BACI|nr:flagellar biosynthetic protein FliO [Cytobacillus eiseniae]MBP2240139.1 flagellar protein FliO/FliZ [Cytobacillus eiseniae]
MQYVKKTFLFLLLIGIALLGQELPASAEQLNNSVKDFYENPESNGEKEESPPEQKEREEPLDIEPSTVGITAWDIIKMILATGFVIALLYFLLKFINKRGKMYNSNQLIENLGGTSLGTNRSVQIIKVGNQVLVVGVGENIQLLKEITDAEECSRIISEYNDKMEQLVQPSDIVTKVLQLKKKNQQTTDNKGNKFQSLLKEQLDDISKGRKKLFDEMEKKGSDER